MKKYFSIKDLVIDVYKHKGLSDYESVTTEIKRYFPKSKWNKNHFSWYRSQIKTGKIKVSGGKSVIETPKLQTDLQVKKIGDELLNHINFILDTAAKDNSDFRFKLNRWVYSRLMQAEICAKRPIKKQLWNSGMKSCQASGCDEKFKALKNVEIHRKNQQKAYSTENCILVCRRCHEKLGINA